MAVYVSVPLCILGMHKLYMYICMYLLSIVATGVLNRCTDMFCICVKCVTVNERKSHNNSNNNREREREVCYHIE